MEGLIHHPGQIVDFTDQVTVFDHWHRDPENIGFLESILSKIGSDGLACQDDHRYGVHLSGEQACDRVRRPWSGSDQYHPGFACGPGISVCHVGSPLFMTHQDDFDFWCIHQSVKNRHAGTSWIAEKIIHPMSAQCFNDDLRSVHKFLDNLFLSFNEKYQFK